MMNEANMCLEGPKGRLISFAVAYQIALLITALPLQAGDTGIPGAHTITQTGSSSAAMQPEGLVGKATYVAERYNGRRTSSGEIYDSRKLTAAHPTIPHGTRVKVLNLANNRSVVVTVNDRCRKRSFEFIDLSRAATRELGFLGKGRTMVRIIPIDE
jgi:rare lipoprotein A